MAKTYKQGNTTVWSDGEKVVIKNTAGRTHVEANVDHIFGVGVFKKMYDTKYTEEYDRKTFASNYELVTGFIPARVKLDLGLPGTEKKDYSEYWKHNDL